MGFERDRCINLTNVTPFFICIKTQINKKFNMATAVFWREKKKPSHTKHTLVPRGTKILPKSSNHLKLLGARRVIRSKLHTEGPKILGSTVHNLVARVFAPLLWPILI